ncbi:hypothetical protein CR973_00650 [Candidatus Saccharibacteria bacterium]|nr:MAG: hypothetical protein CR973_00650 [Candidatus Saccharibacteria bacterium]
MMHNLPPYGERLFDVGDGAPAMRQPDQTKPPICQRYFATIAMRDTAAPGVLTSSADLIALGECFEGSVASLANSIIESAESGVPDRHAIRAVRGYMPYTREEDRGKLENGLGNLVTSVLTSDQPEAEDLIVAAKHISHTAEDGQEELRALLADRVRLMLEKTELSLSSLENAIDLIPYASKADRDELEKLAASKVCPTLKKNKHDLYTILDSFKFIDYMDEENSNEFRKLVARQARSMLGEPRDEHDPNREPDNEMFAILNVAYRLVPRVNREDQDELKELLAHRARLLLEDVKLSAPALGVVIEELIPQASELDQDELKELAARRIRLMLEETETEWKFDVFECISVAELIDSLGDDDKYRFKELVADRIRSALEDPKSSQSDIRYAVDSISAAKEETQTELKGLVADRIRSALGEAGNECDMSAMRSIGSVTHLICDADIEDQREFRSCIADRIRSALEKTELDAPLLYHALGLIAYAEAGDRGELRALAERRIISVAEKELSEDIVELLPYVNEDARAKFIARILQSGLDIGARRTAASYICDIEEKAIKEKLYEIHREHPTVKPEKDLTKNPLYDIAKEKGVVEITKDGLKICASPREQETSIRRTPLRSAAVWRWAYGSWPAWREAGFNYVPIEPFLGVMPINNPDTTAEPEVAVATTNLRGLPYSYASYYFREFASELNAMKETIFDTLSTLGVNPFNLHDGTFVVVPFVKEGGEVDYSRCPRIYATCFDRDRFTDRYDRRRVWSFQNAA